MDVLLKYYMKMVVAKHKWPEKLQNICLWAMFICGAIYFTVTPHQAEYLLGACLGYAFGVWTTREAV